MPIGRILAGQVGIRHFLHTQLLTKPQPVLGGSGNSLTRLPGELVYYVLIGVLRHGDRKV
ncbi:unnamed protein product [Enterobius vermicularis]|uniref:Uncharacterized protein n=1 Tax=Enterobius vermicularis TaxID=51028 RepID=A0A3P6JAX9_ENTVE|nr:unnamed protein product [Enterobius vermicularis]